jgi:hypothetical protein
VFLKYEHSSEKKKFISVLLIRLRIRIDFDGWIRIQEGKNYPAKIEKGEKNHVCNAGCSLLRTEGFSFR